MSTRLAKRIVDALIEDFIDRKGLRQEWEQIDPDVQREIRNEWRDIVDRLLPEER